MTEQRYAQQRRFPRVTERFRRGLEKRAAARNVTPGQGMGVEFIRMEPTERNLLQDLMDRLLQRHKNESGGWKTATFRSADVSSALLCYRHRCVLSIALGTRDMHDDLRRLAVGLLANGAVRMNELVADKGGDSGATGLRRDLYQARNWESRRREAAGHRNWPEAVPRKMRGKKKGLIRFSDNWDRWA